ncbi:MAG: DUF1048 domain-containing protein [Ruminiclostridium sp.]|nr:DUF1048 domain-containing protein [Ruminiclostridium sp.]MBQ9933938.1 DUF1048 domain-containing protein [Ruminiclostridium sp.]
MKSETKRLLKENNEREKLLSKESQKAMTDIVVYLRGCDLSQYHQEEVRRDIQEMVLEAEGRGEDMMTVIGEDYKTFCDEIVSAFPPRSKKEKFLEQLDILLSALGILLVIWLAKSLVIGLSAGEKVWYLSLTAGSLISWAVILVVAEALVWWVTRTAFDQPKEESKGKSFVKVWVIAFLVLSAIFLPSVFLTSPAVEICLPIAVFLAILPFGILWVLGRKI